MCPRTASEMCLYPHTAAPETHSSLQKQNDGCIFGDFVVINILWVGRSAFSAPNQFQVWTLWNFLSKNENNVVFSACDFLDLAADTQVSHFSSAVEISRSQKV